MHVCQPIGDRASFRNGSGRGGNGCFTAWRRRRFPGPCSLSGIPSFAVTCAAVCVWIRKENLRSSRSRFSGWLLQQGRVSSPSFAERRPFRRKRSFRREGSGRKCGPTGPETRLAVHLFASETAAVRRSHSVNTPECSQMYRAALPRFPWPARRPWRAP